MIKAPKRYRSDGSIKLKTGKWVKMVTRIHKNVYYLIQLSDNYIIGYDVMFGNIYRMFLEAAYWRELGGNPKFKPENTKGKRASPEHLQKVLKHAIPFIKRDLDKEVNGMVEALTDYRVAQRELGRLNSELKKEKSNEEGT